MQTGIVTSRGLKLRASVPSGKVIDELAEGDQLEVVGRKRSTTVEWLEVKVVAGGKRGFVAAKYVDVKEEPEPVVIEREAPFPWFLMGAAGAGLVLVLSIWLLR